RDVSIDFSEFAVLVDGLRKIEKALGNTKKVHDKETKIREWAFRSLVSVSRIPRGTVISDAMIWSKRPGIGIPSWRMKEVIGKRAKNDIERNTLISFDDIE
ncbi:MAG: SAF domain-containing protein, partial [Patescibacteria group bacterium]